MTIACVLLVDHPLLSRPLFNPVCPLLYSCEIRRPNASQAAIRRAGGAGVSLIPTARPTHSRTAGRPAAPSERARRPRRKRGQALRMSKHAPSSSNNSRVHLQPQSATALRVKKKMEAEDQHARIPSKIAAISRANTRARERATGVERPDVRRRK